MSTEITRKKNNDIAEALYEELALCKLLFNEDENNSIDTIMSELTGILFELNFPLDKEKSLNVISNNYPKVHELLNKICDRVILKGIVENPKTQSIPLYDGNTRGLMLLNKYLTRDLLVFIKQKN